MKQTTWLAHIRALGNNAYLRIWVVKEFFRFAIISKWDPLFIDLVGDISYICNLSLINNDEMICVLCV